MKHLNHPLANLYKKQDGIVDLGRTTLLFESHCRHPPREYLFHQFVKQKESFRPPKLPDSQILAYSPISYRVSHKTSIAIHVMRCAGVSHESEVRVFRLAFQLSRRRLFPEDHRIMCCRITCMALGTTVSSFFLSFHLILTEAINMTYLSTVVTSATSLAIAHLSESSSSRPNALRM